MYTLRLFKDIETVHRIHFYLGKSYEVSLPDNEDEKIGIKYRVFAKDLEDNKNGIAIYEDHYAYIMSNNGETFETLNKPKIC